jgi:hypothetical protein
MNAEKDALDAIPMRRSRATAVLRGIFEFVLLFGLAVLTRQILIATGTVGYPNPLWLPVIVLSLQHGMATGLTAALAAAGLQLAEGLPPQLMAEDMYSYIGRIAAEPIGWTCVALLIGHVRSRQAAERAELEAELAERTRDAGAVAALCIDLRSRLETLERHIAAESRASDIEVVDAAVTLVRSDLAHLTHDLTRFVQLITGAVDFSIYLLRNGVLALVFQPNDEHLHAVDKEIEPNDPLFAAVVVARRSLRAPADAIALGSHGTLAAPLVEGHTPHRVVGMLAIGGAVEDMPADIDHRLALVCREISQLAGRIDLIDSWHAAGAAPQSDGHTQQTPIAAPRPLEAPAASAQSRQGAHSQTRRSLLPDNELTLR